jgi:hypothetical protein
MARSLQEQAADTTRHGNDCRHGCKAEQAASKNKLPTTSHKNHYNMSPHPLLGLVTPPY